MTTMSQRPSYTHKLAMPAFGRCAPRRQDRHGTGTVFSPPTVPSAGPANHRAR